MWYWCVWQGVTHVRYIEVGEVPTYCILVDQVLYEKSTANLYTLLWQIHCPCYTLSPVLSSSGHHSDGVVCVTLEVSEGGLSCCWVTELLGGLITSLRTVGHSGSVEAVGSRA